MYEHVSKLKLKCYFCQHIFIIFCEVSPEGAPIILFQYWFGQWVYAIREQAITWANVDPDLLCHMASLGLNELRSLCSVLLSWRTHIAQALGGKDIERSKLSYKTPTFDAQWRLAAFTYGCICVLQRSFAFIRGSGTAAGLQRKLPMCSYSLNAQIMRSTHIIGMSSIWGSIHHASLFNERGQIFPALKI